MKGFSAHADRNSCLNGTVR
ncbi:MAG: hypothetical protein ACLRXQ_08750 [Phascolarctobacterium faecium]